MATVVNTKISQLAVLSAAEIADTDVIVMTDLSAGLSKKVEAGSLSSYVLSASLSIPTASIATSASYANNSDNSISSSYSATASVLVSGTTASFSPTASYAFTSSWAENVVGGVSTVSSSYALSSSYSITSSNAELARQAYTLIYTGDANGTASAAISSSYSYTASYVSVGGTVEVTASWATNATVATAATTATTATSATTATTATRLSAGNLSGYRILGPYTGSVSGGTQSSSGSFTTRSFQISDDNDATQAVADKNSQVWITATGTISSSWTGSVAFAPTLPNRKIVIQSYCFDTGTTEALAWTDATLHMFGTAADSYSGSLIIPFTVSGWTFISGSYRFEVTGSDGITFDSNRPSYFRLETNATNFSLADWPNV